MPIHDQGYRRYGGKRAPHGRTWWIIARTHMFAALKFRSFVILLLASWLPFVARGVQIYLSSSFQQVSVLAEQVGARVDRVIARTRTADGDVALFAHGHVLRVLAARWLELPTVGGQHFLLGTGTLSVLGYYHDIPAVKIWNGPLLD